MMNLTEREEQELIEKAKGGDPKANYDMSLWALEQSVAEPDEERWNRLAAKCLVKAAEAGYEPAKERMNQLLAALHAEEAKAPASPAPETADSAETPPTEGQEFDWSGEPDARPQAERTPQEQPTFALRAVAVGGIAAKAVGTGAKFVWDKSKVLWSKGKELVESYSAQSVEKAVAEESDEDIPDTDAPETGDLESAAPASVPAAPAPTRAKHASSSQKLPLPDFSRWDDAKWKKMQMICVAVCVVLAILIAILITSGKKDTAEEEVSAVPPAATTAPATPTPTVEPVLYPNAAIRAEIQMATLDVYPTDSDYVTEETTATVTPGAGLNLRRGPGSGYSQIVLMSYNSTLEVYAYQNGWALVRYNNSTWGWCSDDYIKVQ